MINCITRVGSLDPLGPFGPLALLVPLGSFGSVDPGGSVGQAHLTHYPIRFILC